MSTHSGRLVCKGTLQPYHPEEAEVKIHWDYPANPWQHKLVTVTLKRQTWHLQCHKVAGVTLQQQQTWHQQIPVTPCDFSLSATSSLLLSQCHSNPCAWMTYMRVLPMIAVALLGELMHQQSAFTSCLKVGDTSTYGLATCTRQGGRGAQCTPAVPRGSGGIEATASSSRCAD